MAGDGNSTVWRWQALAALALLGWGATAAGWYLDGDDRSPAARSTEALTASPLAARGPTRDSTRPRRRRMTETVRQTPAAAAVDTEALEARVREEVVEEIQAERQERRRQRGEERLARGLEAIEGFVAEHGLEEAAQVRLEEALIAMHDRMEALRGDGPPGPRDDAHHEAVRASFDQLDTDVREVVGDELAESFNDWMRPPGRRGPR